MKAAIYIRVSTQEQAQEGFSIAAQKNRSISFCDSQGWEIYDFFVDDGYSAKDMERPGLQRMLADARNKKFDVIVVYRLDRLTRSVSDLYKILDEIEKHSIKFKSVTEVYDTTTATGRLFITLVAALAQWERENLAERVYVGMEEMASQGKRPGGTLCYGYKINENGDIVPDAYQAKIVRTIFDMYERNQSIRVIQKFLERNKVPPPKLHWSTTTLNYLLRNPFYVGKIRWNLRKRNKKTGKEIIVNGQHEPIISETQFYRVQKLIDKRRSVPPAAATSDFLFSGILKCGKCGHAMSGTSRTYKTVRTKYYACVSRQKYFKCDMPYVREDKLKETLIDYIQKELFENDPPAEMEDPVEVENAAYIEELKKRLEKVEERKKKFQLMYIDDLISREDYVKRKQELDDEQESIMSALNEIAVMEEGTETIEKEYLLENFLNLIETADPDEMKVLCQELFHTIRVEKFDEREVKLNIDYN